ncbi:DHS-like NAD/FAD-binding domain-containing protein [Hysterangium stoloniferum]|nr:DHS-like NAD/FAD-binding domain-containing protein [Hysterangium stoloniferum]
MDGVPLSDFQAVFTKSKKIVVIAGAGLSAASGIPTFRGAGGWWRKYDAKALATPEAFARNPSLVWQFYHYRREVASSAKPNAAHWAIAHFCASPPPGATFRLITQNVDGLSTRALHPNAPEIAKPIEMHGNVFRVKCTHCDYSANDYNTPICPGLAGTETVFRMGQPEPIVRVKDLPSCPECKGLLRPGVVWFGEQIEREWDISMITKGCDLLLVVGTSSTVQPAASFAQDAKDNGAQVAVFNIERTPGDTDADFLFLGPCEQSLLAAFGLEEDEIDDS